MRRRQKDDIKLKMNRNGPGQDAMETQGTVKTTKQY